MCADSLLLDLSCVTVISDKTRRKVESLALQQQGLDSAVSVSMPCRENSKGGMLGFIEGTTKENKIGAMPDLG